MQGQKNYVGSFVWPFVRYDVLMPRQIQTDLFVWLYLSLVVHQNEQRRLERNCYIKEVKDDVRHMIKQRFSSLLDDTVIDGIISSAENDFTVQYDTQFGSGKYLSTETFSFLNTYEELFTSDISAQKVFQDGICGGVVPCFEDDVYVKDAKKDCDCELGLLVKNKPTQGQIKKAYVLYNRLRTAASSRDDVLEEEEEFYDEDVEVDFAPEMQDFAIENSEEKSLPQANFSAQILDESRCEFKLEISIYSNGEKLFIDTPFDSDLTLKWINKRLPQARSVCEELDRFLNGLEAKYLAPKSTEKTSKPLQFVYRKGVAEQMTKCGDIYRLIEHLPEQYNDLKKLLIDIDKQFASKHKSYFNSLGTYLECLLSQFADRSDVPTRQYFDYNQYCAAVNYTCTALGVKSRPFLSENIFKNWQKGWEHFKADLVELFFVNADMKSNAKLYPEFVQDTFDLYDKRNDGSHYKPGVKYNYDDADITKLFNVTRVFVELI